MQLDAALSEWYSATVLHHGDASVLLDRFQAAMRLSPTLKQEAQAKLDAMAGVDDKRCFITKTYRQFLERVLSHEK